MAWSMGCRRDFSSEFSGSRTRRAWPKAKRGPGSTVKWMAVGVDCTSSSASTRALKYPLASRVRTKDSTSFSMRLRRSPFVSGGVSCSVTQSDTDASSSLRPSGSGGISTVYSVEAPLPGAACSTAARIRQKAMTSRICLGGMRDSWDQSGRGACGVVQVRTYLSTSNFRRAPA